MEKAEFKKCLKALDAQWQQDLSITDSLSKVFPEAPIESLLPANGILVKLILSLMANSIGCDISLLEWWCFDNDFGHNGLRLRIDGVLVKVKEDNLYECLIYCKD